MCTLVKNVAQCGRCKSVIESTHRHDYVRCACGDIAVDGGKAYHYRVFDSAAAWVDLSVFDPCADPQCRDKSLENVSAEPAWAQ